MSKHTIETAVDIDAPVELRVARADGFRQLSAMEPFHSLHYGGNA
ncbi:hypothetical protein [Methylosinus sp. Sm6]|nr:hypothetical protein [Methylosinus sp. Sm6]